MSDFPVNLKPIKAFEGASKSIRFIMAEGFVVPSQMAFEVYHNRVKQYEIAPTYDPSTRTLVGTLSAEQIDALPLIAELRVRFDDKYPFKAQLKPTTEGSDDGVVGYNVSLSGDAYTVVEIMGMDLVTEQVAIATDKAAEASEKAEQASADALQTLSDRTQTGQDRTATAADRVQTGLDKVATAADRIATAADRVATGEDRDSVRADAVQTAADRVQTGLDKAATNSDRTQTALDRAAASASEIAAAASASVAQGARDSAIIQSGSYLTEAAGRAAVLDGQAFKVQGSADVAAFEYRRIDANTSTLLATYPTKGYIERKVKEVFSPATVVGRRFIAKGNTAGTSGNKLIQPDFLFDASAISFGGANDTYVFSCKIIVNGANIASIINHVQQVTASSTPGVNGTPQNTVGGAANPMNGITLDYSSIKTWNTPKQNYVHNFINFDPIDESANTEIVIYDPVLTINGVQAAFVGAALYSPNGTDTTTSITALSDPAATKAYTDQVKVDSIAYSDKQYQEVFAPSDITGFRFVAKAGTIGTAGSKRIQPDILFNAGAIAWGGTPVLFEFNCKIVVTGNNIASIARHLVQVSNLASPGSSGGVSLTFGNPANPVPSVTLDYYSSSIVNTTKNTYVHNFVDFDPIDESLDTEIVIFNPSLKIGGVQATLVGAGIFSKNASDTITSITKLRDPAATIPTVGTMITNALNTSGFATPAVVDQRVDLRLDAIAIDNQVNGHKFTAKENANNRVQVNFTFDLTPIAYTATSVGQFKFKVLVKNNVNNIISFVWFLNNTTGFNTTGDQISAAGSDTVTNNVVREYTKSSTLNFAKGATRNYAHCYAYFDLIDGALATEIIIYDISFTVDGVATTRLPGAGLYMSVSGDKIQNYTTTNPLPTFKYVDDNILAATTPLAGKILNALGDSITAGGSGLGVANAYCNVVAARNGMTINNYGISGTCLSIDNAFGFGMANPTRYQAMAEADYITVFGGTNDFPVPVPIGSNSDNTQSTFKGALNILCIGLIEKYSTKRIGFLTPLNHRGSAGMLPYADAILEICRLYSIPVLDLYRESGIYPLNAVQRTALMMSSSDYQHPNPVGHLLLASKYEAFLKRL